MMILSLRRRRASNKKIKTQIPESDSEMTEVVIPTHFRCPITLDLMKDPVTLSTGITYDRDSIEKWIESGNRTCPVTNQVLKSFDQIPNHTILRMIQDWCVENRSRGVERIPTPRIPVTPYEVSSVCERIAVATRKGDRKRCRELVEKVKVWAKESERNRKCLAGGGIGRVLSLSLEGFAVVFSNEGLGEEERVDVRLLLEQILSVLSCVSSDQGRVGLLNDTSLRCLVSFLGGNDLSARQNAVLLIKELLSSSSSNDGVAESMAEIEGGVEALVRMVKEPVSPKAMKASLTAIFHMINIKNDKIRSRFLDLGLVSLLLENILEGEKGVSERSLRILDVVCDYKEGREQAYDNALTIPLVVKRILRVSDLASDFLVSILWKLCKNAESREDSVLVEALQVGAFQKLLIMLQIGCGEKMKEKVTELLKIFNLHRRRLDCVDSSAEFKYLKKPF